MKILITGVCGFIGFNMANKFLNDNSKNKVYGLDNLDNYYSVILKKKRLNILKLNKNFFFEQIDITKKKN
jgi:UDP-glucuronate 4-epimerase